MIDANQPGEVHDLLGRHRDRLAEQLTDAERRLVLIEQLAAKEQSMADIIQVDLPSQRVAAQTVEGPTEMVGPLVTAAFHESSRPCKPTASIR